MPLVFASVRPDTPPRHRLSARDRHDRRIRSLFASSISPWPSSADPSKRARLRERVRQRGLEHEAVSASTM